MRGVGFRCTMYKKNQGAGNEMGNCKLGCSIVNKMYRTGVRIESGDAVCGHSKELEDV